jgi:hypothetical protein
MAIDTDPGFEGFPPAWYFFDRTAGKLTAAPPAGSAMAQSANVTLSLSPRFFNAPKAALGSTAQTKFDGNGKPNAYLKVQVTQDRAGSGAMKPLTWSAMYPVLDGANDDIANVFFDDPVSGDPVQAVPLPGGTASLSTPLTAIVGGPRQSKLADILGKVLGVASSTSGKALFPIPAADVALASNVESLLNFGTTAFAPSTRQQFWLNQTSTPIRVTPPDGSGDDSLVLPKGSSFLVAFQDVDGGAVVSAVNHVAQDPTVSVQMNRGGQLSAVAKDGTVSNPFANLIYVTFKATVNEA